jgi:DNA-binding NarL/FixJ family response regulator
MTKSVRVLLADDHALVRAGFRMLLDNLESVQVVAEADDGRRALELVKEHQPDIVFMDVAMPGLNGLEAASQLAEAYPHVRVIILSMHANEEYVLRALRAGAAGYLLKDSGPQELELAIAAVTHGETYLSPPVSRLVTDYIRRTGDTIADTTADTEPETTSLDRLTPRQREILQLIAEGHSTKEAARILGISVKTAETHRTRLMEHLDIRDITGLVRYAIRVGLVTTDQ